MKLGLILQGLIQIRDWGVSAKQKDGVEGRKMVEEEHSYRREQHVQNRVPLRGKRVGGEMEPRGKAAVEPWA